MDLSRLMSRLAAIGGMQGAVTEAEEEKCSECGKVHEGDCDAEKVEEGKKPDFIDADNDGNEKEPMSDALKDKEEKVDEGKKPDFIDADNDGNKKEPMSDALKDKEKVEETSLDSLRKLAGIMECGDEYEMGGEMSPMSVTATEVPGMGVPAQVANMVAGAEGESSPKAKYTLSIQNGENNLQMTTDVPDEIIHIMKLAGVNKGAEVTKTEAPGEEQNEAPKKEVEEEWSNTPSQTKEREPKAYGDIRDWGQKGTGQGKPGSGTNRPAGQGDNPLGEQAMMEAYKKFKASK
jgi:hypothetical protein